MARCSAALFGDMVVWSIPRIMWSRFSASVPGLSGEGGPLFLKSAVSTSRRWCVEGLLGEALLPVLEESVRLGDVVDAPVIISSERWGRSSEVAAGLDCTVWLSRPGGDVAEADCIVSSV